MSGPPTPGTPARDGPGPSGGKARPPSGAPAVAVVVPVFGHADRLPALLAGLSAQVWPDFEIVLVDNAPEPDPRLRQAVDGSSLARARVIHCPRPGSYAARNAGAAAATAEWLAFTDADCRPAAGWLDGLMRARAEGGTGLLAGPVRVRPEGAPNCWAVFDTVRGIPQERYVRRGYAVTANLGLPRALFEALGGFDGTRMSGGDAEFCRRAGGRGVALTLVPDAVVDHPARSTWEDLATKARRTKGGQVSAGRWRRRAWWTLRNLLPPVHEMRAYLRSDHPWPWRAVACGVRLALWGAEVIEIGRLLILRGAPERR